MCVKWRDGCVWSVRDGCWDKHVMNICEYDAVRCVWMSAVVLHPGCVVGRSFGSEEERTACTPGCGAAGDGRGGQLEQEEGESEGEGNEGEG